MTRLLACSLLGVSLFGAVRPSLSQEQPNLKTVGDVPPVKIPGLDRTIPPDTTTLDLGHTEVTDAGLKELAPLQNLTTLSLRDTKVTDAGLKELAPLKNLTTLDLPRSVTDAGLKELAGLKSLTTLRLSATWVTDAGLKELAGLKNLTALDLSWA